MQDEEGEEWSRKMSRAVGFGWMNTNARKYQNTPSIDGAVTLKSLEVGEYEEWERKGGKIKIKNWKGGNL